MVSKLGFSQLGVAFGRRHCLGHATERPLAWRCETGIRKGAAVVDGPAAGRLEAC